ncbi:hypothetical protein MAPG_11826 [Magnaporthiopsis poae ATCC 64411]|uniref:Rhodopsin domain-containing protein n=1 Tax=Magnaporthiopsis poae (strain ATCC 64411 / 73-15) TaxID=644358 RepID=A0A0C4EG99_MAGP6|nr:hypothetical protein MAPG_11826 [Magnaporthiopsis poae ATCC 64411]
MSRFDSSEFAPPLSSSPLLLDRTTATAHHHHHLWQRRDAGVGMGIDQSLLDQIDWNNKSNLAPSVKVVNIIVITIVAVVVALRIWVRATIVGRLMPDDILIIIAAIFQFVTSAMGILATNYGLGQHIWNLPGTVNAILAQASMICFVFNVFWSATVAITKLSILYSFLRIFELNTRLRKVLYIIGAVVTGHTIATIFATIFECTPVSTTWEVSVSIPLKGSGHCIDMTAFVRASTAINIVTDFAVCLAPIPSFWKIQVSIRQRVGLIVLFLLGICACFSSIYRLVIVWKIKMDTVDWLYILANVMNTAVAETCTGIICVSIPALKPLIEKFLPNLFGTRSSRAKASSAKAVGSSAGSAAAGSDGRPLRGPTMSGNRAVTPVKDDEDDVGTEMIEIGLRKTVTDEEMAMPDTRRLSSAGEPRPRAKRNAQGWYELKLN